MIPGMEETNNKFPEHACQLCGAERKLVETLIDDEFVWDETDRAYQPNGFMDCFANMPEMIDVLSVKKIGLGYKTHSFQRARCFPHDKIQK